MHPIENILKSTMTELKEMIDVNTIVGSPFVSPNGCTIIPISKVSFGFVTGGAQYGNAKEGEGEHEFPFGGGATSGVTIAPVAFMVADDDIVKVLTISHRNALDKLMENAPQLVREMRDIVTEGCSKHSES
ncbi:MAG: GerW family sporulation protein [Christensenellaceae bacterium]|nr:GerW family sporulation protein [Christensenellaceae bacterium]